MKRKKTVTAEVVPKPVNDAAPVPEKDHPLYDRLFVEGFAVLLIRPGHIALPGYDTGFIGGCCGKLAPDELAFAGALSSRPDGERMREFLHSRCVAPVELREGPLVDVGGILPLREHCGSAEGGLLLARKRD